MYCSKCGKEVLDEAVVCTNCGCSLRNVPSAPQSSSKPDGTNTGIAILSFLIPLAGLIIFLLNKDERPIYANQAGKMALIGFIVSIVCSIVSTVAFSCIGLSLVSYY